VYLGAGATVAVYEAHAVEGTEPPSDWKRVAVKVPRKPEWKDSLKAEMQTIQNIQKGWGNEPFFPCARVREGVIEGESDGFVLLLEYIPREWQVSRQKLGKQDLLLLARQYARLLQIVHENLQRTCGDRKDDDMYWDAANKRLNVLDWAVTTERQRKTPEEQQKDESLMRADINAFGKWWYRLAVGEGVSDSTLAN